MRSRPSDIGVRSGTIIRTTKNYVLRMRQESNDTVIVAHRVNNGVEQQPNAYLVGVNYFRVGDDF